MHDSIVLPLRLMWNRLELARSDADTTFFLHLLYTGEMLLKLVTAGMLAAITDDRDHHRYRLIHGLVRTDGLGDWVQALDEALVGPASQHLIEAVADDRRSLTERFGPGAWQHKAVHDLGDVLKSMSPDMEPLPVKVPLRQWFSNFATLRNKTRAHGAPTPGTCARLSPQLEQSVGLLTNNLPLFCRPWVYLHRNLSGKYRVVGLAGDVSRFEYLKTSSGINSFRHPNFSDGVYIDFGELMRVELLETSVDITDFFFPNGAFNGKTFELLSLITDNRGEGNAQAYMAPAGDRPNSETEGRGSLDVVGKTMANLPPISEAYVRRPELEKELYETICDDRHPVLTLVGRGGIGKTSLAVSVLHQIAQSGLFDVIVWFSARDIDLLLEGPKVVAPRVLSQADMADQFVQLFDPTEAKQKGFKATPYLASSLTKSPIGKPILFVFDNFETVRNPGDLFTWLDTHIRLPNKILITTRQREFKADYPIEVLGMTESEATLLVESTAQRLGITSLLTSDYRSRIYEESDGHPYIIKVLLGEVAKAKKLVKVERIVAGKDDILDALFERTYAGLTPVAKRVFLTLCSWRSLVPQVALEAALLRPSNERMDVEAAVDELVRSSFVERTTAPDDTSFLDVALVASVFGRRKLEISSMKAAIDADLEFLQQIGAITTSGVRHGVQPRLEQLFQNIATRLTQGRVELNTVIPSLEFISRQYTPAWLMLAKLHEEIGGPDGIEPAIQCIQRFLESPQSIQGQTFAWRELARLYSLQKDWTGAASARLRESKLPGTPFSTLSNTANWLNSLLRENSLAIDSDEKRLLVRDLAFLMERRTNEADATDLSRLAWLYLHLRDEARAREVARDGLSIDSRNEHCLRLITRLGT